MAAVSDQTRVRLDELLVRQGHFPSRSRARDAVLRGAVTVDGNAEHRPGRPVAPHSTIAIDDPARRFVARSALKLVAGLDAFDIDAQGAVALDIGASTGGFTQVLLERGAAHVTSIDVGHGQFHETLRGDPRVTTIEGVNARDLTAAHLGGKIPDLLVADVSFISLRLAMPPALALATPGARAVLLVKPQFEAGREAIGKGGLLRDPSTARQVAEGVAAWLDVQPGWGSLGLVDSPIDGGDGNAEFLLGGTKDR